MGQIIRLPLAPPAHPEITADLGPAEGVLLIAVRWWVADFRQHDDPLPRVCQVMDTAGAYDAAFAVDQLMALFVRAARRSMAIHCPRCPDLSEDEKHLLHAARLVQAGETKMAERALRLALLSAQDAECALGPLESLGDLFTEARLIFRRRKPSDKGQASIAAVEPWIPAARAETIH